MAEPASDQADDDARYEARESGRDARARVATVLHVLLALAPLVVGVFGRLSQGTHAGVEDAMELLFFVVSVSVPVWLIAVVIALTSFRMRAIAACVLYPIAWMITTRFI